MTSKKASAVEYLRHELHDSSMSCRLQGHQERNNHSACDLIMVSQTRDVGGGTGHHYAGKAEKGIHADQGVGEGKGPETGHSTYT